MRVVGVDGCRQGWVGVALAGGRLERVVLHARLEALLADLGNLAVVGVDMPIGLVDVGWRGADEAARSFLGRRASTVFKVPPRPVLEAATYGEANELCRRITGQGVSRQAYGLAKKILEVDPIAACDARVHEIHPEVAFQLLAGAPLAGSKKTWAGVTERQALLADAGIELPPDIGPAGRAAMDDVLDAAVVAWSAGRIATGAARCFPEQPGERHPDGRPIAIWG